ncbi:MAG TPA: glycosyltransferase family 9 protein [Acidobacteriaceae bacterium]|nr:glycosyltransferase family 9 protein [Acidobacteriaceae bacterium]
MASRKRRLTPAKVLKSAVFSIAAGLERVVRPTSREPLDAARNFLLLQHPMALGPVVHATPLIPALRAATPGSRIAVAASGMATEIFANNPGVDCLIATPSPLTDLSGAISSWRRQNPFGRERFVALTTLGNERTRIGIAALASGASARIGFTEAPELYRAALRFDASRSVIENNLRIVEVLGFSSRHFEPQTFFADADLAWARATLAANGGREGQMVAVFVTQTSVTQRKSWRAERFQAAARHLMERYGAHIVFVGTAAEAAAIEQLRAGLGPATSSVAGKTSLLRLSALLSLCRVGLTLDTGTMHIGRTVGLPMCIIAPAWSPPIEWLPLGDPRYRILKNAEMDVCPPDYGIDEVSVDEVTAALDQLIASFAGATLPAGDSSARDSLALRH